MFGSGRHIFLDMSHTLVYKLVLEIGLPETLWNSSTNISDEQFSNSVNIFKYPQCTLFELLCIINRPKFPLSY